MAGTWTTQNKVIPSAYVNFLANKPMGITVGERGTVMLMMELTGNTADKIYTVTATENNLTAQATGTNKTMIDMVLENASVCKIYVLKDTHEPTDVDNALSTLKLQDFDVLAYPYTTSENITKIVTWVKSMNEDEGAGIVGVLAGDKTDSEYITNVKQGVVLGDGENTSLTKEQFVPWVAGATAGATISESLTGKAVLNAVDVSPRMTRTEMETAIKNGEFILKVDNAQNVSVVYDINSLTTVTTEKPKMFQKNRLIRLVSTIRKDIATVFETNYMGKINNNELGRSLFKSALVDYFKELERLEAIENFNADDIEIKKGYDNDSVVVDVAIQTVDSVEKLYMTVNLQ